MVASEARACECAAGYLLAPGGARCSADCAEFAGTVVSLDNASCIPAGNCNLISIDEARCVSACGENQQAEGGRCRCADGFTAFSALDGCALEAPGGSGPMNTGMIVGLTLGGLVLVALVAVGIVFRKKIALMFRNLFGQCGGNDNSKEKPKKAPKLKPSPNMALSTSPHVAESFNVIEPMPVLRTVEKPLKMAPIKELAPRENTNKDRKPVLKQLEKVTHTPAQAFMIPKALGGGELPVLSPE